MARARTAKQRAASRKNLERAREARRRRSGIKLGLFAKQSFTHRKKAAAAANRKMRKIFGLRDFDSWPHMKRREKRLIRVLTRVIKGG